MVYVTKSTLYLTSLLPCLDVCTRVCKCVGVTPLQVKGLVSRLLLVSRPVFTPPTGPVPVYVTKYHIEGTRGSHISSHSPMTGAFVLVGVVNIPGHSLLLRPIFWQFLKFSRYRLVIQFLFPKDSSPGTHCRVRWVCASVGTCIRSKRSPPFK